MHLDMIIENNVALIISLMALVFTIYSFYYLNWRKGKLIIGSPISYAMTILPKNDKGEGLWVELPFVFYNDGAATQFVQNMRLILQQNGTSMKCDFDAIRRELPWSTLPSGEKSTSEIAHQFAIEGRKAYFAIFAFGCRPTIFIPSEGICQAKLEAKLNDSSKWGRLHEFDIIIWKLTVDNLNKLRPYSNDPDAAPENAERI